MSGSHRRSRDSRQSSREAFRISTKAGLLDYHEGQSQLFEAWYFGEGCSRSLLRRTTLPVSKRPFLVGCMGKGNVEGREREIQTILEVPWLGSD